MWYNLFYLYIYFFSNGRTTTIHSLCLVPVRCSSGIYLSTDDDGAELYVGYRILLFHSLQQVPGSPLGNTSHDSTLSHVIQSCQWSLQLARGWWWLGDKMAQDPANGVCAKNKRFTDQGIKPSEVRFLYFRQVVDWLVGVAHQQLDFFLSCCEAIN